MKNAMVIVMSILLFTVLTSCHSYMDINSLQEFEEYQDKSNTYVLQVQTVQYSIINFSAKFPARMSNAEVVGIQHVLLDKFKYDSVVFKGKSPNLTPIYAVKDEIRYKIVSQDFKNLVCFTSDTIRIPFSEIRKMHLKKINLAKSLLIGGGIAAFVAGLIYFIVINMTFTIDMSM